MVLTSDLILGEVPNELGKSLDAAPYKGSASAAVAGTFPDWRGK